MIVTVCGIASASFLAGSEYLDRQTLRTIALQVTQGIESPGKKVSALNEWVYQNQGFAKNRRGLPGFSRLGPTPMQVLEHGGDCADKSRLLSAMMETLGMQSSLAMLYPCLDCPPVHTVVVADIGEVRTLADPVFNITFPRPDQGFYSVEELVNDPSLLHNRLQELRLDRGPKDKILYYRESNHRYDYLTTINWRANFLTRSAGNVLRSLGIEARYAPRPMWLENPKRALAILSLMVAAAGAIFWLIVRSRTAN